MRLVTTTTRSLLGARRRRRAAPDPSLADARQELVNADVSSPGICGRRRGILLGSRSLSSILGSLFAHDPNLGRMEHPLKSPFSQSPRTITAGAKKRRTGFVTAATASVKGSSGEAQA